MPGSWQPTVFVQWTITLITIVVHQCWFRLGTRQNSTIQNSAPKFKKKALLVGIQYTSGEDQNELRGPHSDVRGMQQLLIDCYGYDPRDIVILIDNNKPDQDQLQPTRDNIIQNMNELVNGARQGDRFFFYFVGSREELYDMNEEDEDGLNESILTCDNENIPDKKLCQLLARPLPAGSTLVTVSDCGHSGSLLDLKHSHCNSAYVPWINKGLRRTNFLRNIVAQQNTQPDISDSP